MTRLLKLLGLVALLSMSLQAHQAATPGLLSVRVFVQGDTSRLPDFVDSLRREFSGHGMSMILVERNGEFDYNIVLAQESSIGGAAAAVIVLDRGAGFVTSVVRSGRLSGKGAFNASAKELAKKIAILRGVNWR
ncbi:MAG: hypothetical protein ACRD2A_05645 [Vicinamibacterales bacterium]